MAPSMEQAVERSAEFEDYYSRYRRIVYDAAIRMVGNHSEAEDVTQQVFLKVWSKPDTFRGGNFGAWLKAVTHNLSIDLLRRRRTVLLGDIAVDAFRDSQPLEVSPEDEVIREITAASVRAAMRGLRPNELALVQASFMSDQSHNQIARSAALPLGTVKTRIRVALRRMRPSVAGLQ